jgi:uncharacterized membrane protein
MMSVAATQQPTVPGPPRRRALWIALFASLAVNVFLIGWISSSWIADAPRVPSPRGERSDFSIRAARTAVGEDQRRIADRIWRERRSETRVHVKNLREAKLELRRVLTADQLDAAALEQAVANLRARGDTTIERLTTTLVLISKELAPEARKAFFTAGFTRNTRRDRAQN